MLRKGLFLLFLAAATQISFAQNIPAGDRVYDLLIQASLRGLIQDALPEHRPFTRIEIAGFLINIENNRKLNPDIPPVLYSELRRQVEFYKREIVVLAGEEWWITLQPYEGSLRRYCRFFYHRNIPSNLIDNRGNLVSIDFDNNRWLTINPSYAFQFDQTRTGDNIFRRRWGFVFESAPSSWMTLSLRWRDVLEWGNEPYHKANRQNIFDDRIGYYNGKSGENLVYEDLLGGLTVHRKQISFFIGRDILRWGPGRTGNLLLSGESPPYDHASLRIDIGKKIHFTALHGNLTGINADGVMLQDTLYLHEGYILRTMRRQKYLTAHRIEIEPVNKLTIGIHEAVVYGERPLDISYLNPVSVYFTNEHENGDYDNALMGADFHIGPGIIIPGKLSIMFWGEFLLDDFQFSLLGEDHYDAKSAWLSGLELALSGGLMPVELGYEYMRIRPYVYTHVYSINRYTHWNSPLGVQVQPNTDRSAFWMSWWLISDLRFGVEWYYLRHGENPDSNTNVGGDLYQSHITRYEDTAKFLSGTRKDYSRTLLWFEWGVIERLNITCAAGYDNSINGVDDGKFISLGFIYNRPEDRRWSLRGK
ncbi:capsule assembly Wzi family protein [Calditrichota bacterium]